MINFKQLEKSGLTPGKAILIGVLSVILIAVLITNLMPADSPAAAKTEPKRRSPIRDVAARPPGIARNPKAELAQPRIVRKWPIISLDTAVAHDPFAIPKQLLPEKEPEPVAASATVELGPDLEVLRLQRLRARKEKLEALRDLQRSGVGIALVTPEEQVITIGNKKLHVGDEWGGFRIKEIRPDGSVVVDID